MDNSVGGYLPIFEIMGSNSFWLCHSDYVFLRIGRTEDTASTNRSIQAIGGIENLNRNVHLHIHNSKGSLTMGDVCKVDTKFLLENLTSTPQYTQIFLSPLVTISNVHFIIWTVEAFQIIFLVAVVLPVTSTWHINKVHSSATTTFIFHQLLRSLPYICQHFDYWLCTVSDMSTWNIWPMTPLVIMAAQGLSMIWLWIPADRHLFGHLNPSLYRWQLIQYCLPLCRSCPNSLWSPI